MKALILAAGLGTRLAPLTNNQPKCLVTVCGKPILCKQIENLRKHGVTDITVIAGYKADVVRKTIFGIDPQIRVVDSVDYESTNNMYSAYLGKKFMEGNEFLMMNADVFFDDDIIHDILDHKSPNTIAVEQGKFLEESMKVVKREGRIISISKEISRQEAYGTSIDLYKFSSIAGIAFFEKCREYIEDYGERKLWSEVALHDILNEILFQDCPVRARWTEIDTHEDLKEAERIFQEIGTK